MGRQEKPLDPDGGPAQRFASALRELRRQSGSPTYRAMARHTRFTAPTLSRAAGGEQLPSLPVTLAYVTACGGNSEEWERRWREASREVAAEPPNGSSTSGTSDDADAPYPGLSRFEPGDGNRFFGREQFVAQLLRRVRTGRFTAVFGPSGSGKSSLLRAGLIPALRRAPAAPEGPGQPAAIRILTPGEHPALTRGALLTPADGGGGEDTIVIVDQFEEIFTLCRDPAERTEFIDLLLAARRPGSRLRAVIAVRGDFYGRCAAHPELAAALNEGSLLVGAMGRAELRAAIVQPAQAAGLIVERSLTARIVDDVAGEPGGLPLMSHALLETWRRRRGRVLSLAAYEAAGGLRGAVARTAEETYSRFTPEQAELARQILLRLITPGEGVPDTRRPAERAELDFAAADEVEVVVERLARARLVTLDGGTVELAHESLITAWPRLRGWIDAARDRLRLHRRLTQDAHAWEELARDPGALYRGSRLAAAEEALPAERREGELTALERAFLGASVEARARERRAATRTARRLRALAIGLSLLLVTAVTTTVVAVRQREAADEAQQVALSRQLAAESTALLGSDLDLASLLAVAAYRTSPTVEAATSLHAVAALPLKHRLAGHTGAPLAVGFSADGDTVASASLDGTARRWDTATGKGRNELRIAGAPDPAAPQSTDPPAVLSADGRLLAVASAWGTVYLWDLETGLSGWFDSGTGGTLALAFSPDGTTLASGHDDGTVRLWNITDFRRWDDASAHPLRRTLTGHTGEVGEVVFSPDATLLASSGSDRVVRLWDPTTGEPRHALTSYGRGPASIAFGADGTSLAVGSDDGAVWMWNAATGERGGTFAIHPGLNAVAFAPEGGAYATSGADGTVRVWNSNNWDPWLVLPEHALALAFSPDGTTLATAGRDGTVRLWDVASGKQPRDTLLTDEGAVRAMAFSPDGGALATAGTNGRVQLWDTATGVGRWTSPVESGGSGGPVSQLALAPGGARFATGSEGGTVQVWDLGTGQLRRTLTGHTHGIVSLAFGPDGTTLASAGADGTVRVWDLATGTFRFLIGTGVVAPMAFSPDGTTLVTGDAWGRVRLWDLTTDDVRREVVHPSSVVSLAFNPDGTALATIGEDGSVRLWSATTGALRHTLDQSGPVESVAFSPDGTLLATGSMDGEIALWDVATGGGRGAIRELSAVTSLAFSPDSTTLAAATQPGTAGLVGLWDVDVPTLREAISRLCRALHRDLTPEERAVYLPEGTVDSACPR